MHKIIKIATTKFHAQLYNEYLYKFHWTLCVSVATSLLSTSWVEFFFKNEEDAYGFEKFCREAGYATLMATPEEY